jgi:hypothetical protein
VGFPVPGWWGLGREVGGKVYSHCYALVGIAVGGGDGVVGFPRRPARDGRRPRHAAQRVDGVDSRLAPTREATAEPSRSIWSGEKVA